jgi:phosphoribosylformylglycinamidine synthase subunit PurQ / glutaminase
MSRVKALVVSGNGTNCERETAYACDVAGARTTVAPIWDLIAGETRLSDHDFLCLPGGFMDGDDLGSARAGANRYRHASISGSKRRLWDDLLEFVEAGKLVLGICNGFQLLVKLGLLPGFSRGRQEVTLTFNDSGRFEDRWVELGTDDQSPCIFTRGLSRLPLPVRHGEGKLVAESEGLTDELLGRHLAPLQYLDPSTGLPTDQYPHNPNGSPRGIAGVCDPTGRIFGLMPHPECYLHRIHHPRWRRLHDLPEKGWGLKIFENAVAFFR